MDSARRSQIPKQRCNFPSRTIHVPAPFITTYSHIEFLCIFRIDWPINQLINVCYPVYNLCRLSRHKTRIGTNQFALFALLVSQRLQNGSVNGTRETRIRGALISFNHQNQNVQLCNRPLSWNIGFDSETASLRLRNENSNNFVRIIKYVGN